MKGPTKKSDIKPHWMAEHTHLKNEFTEDEMYHNLMQWLICVKMGGYNPVSQFHLHSLHSTDHWVVP